MESIFPSESRSIGSILIESVWVESVESESGVPRESAEFISVESARIFETVSNKFAGCASPLSVTATVSDVPVKVNPKKVKAINVAAIRELYIPPCGPAIVFVWFFSKILKIKRQ